MNRKDFLKTSGTIVATALIPLNIVALDKQTVHASTDSKMCFLGSDQSDNYIRLFTDKKNNSNELIEEDIWKYYPSGFTPTDAKRVDFGKKTSVIIACHGAIFEVPYNYEDKVIVADTHSGCHSVEKLPDGNMISANSNEHQLTIHFDRVDEGADKIRLKNSIDYRFKWAHGVVYDKVRKCVWAIGGNIIAKFEYVSGSMPHLKQLESFTIPIMHTGGHDIFPSYYGSLLITTHQGVLELDIGDFARPTVKYLDAHIKSVSDNRVNGDIYISDPTDIDGYPTFQTDTILNIKTGNKLKRPGAKFYKVRLWQRNSFSYQ